MKLSSLHEQVVKGSYIATVLSPESKDTLLQWWENVVRIPLLDRPIAHHVTLKYEPTERDLQQYQIDQETSVKVIGYSADEYAQAVLVRSDILCHNKHPHITISVSHGTPPSYSKALLAQNITRVDGPTLTGSINHLLPSRLHEAKKTDFSKEKKSGLHGWFSRAGGEGKKGWVDCNTCRTDPKTGKKTCKPCGRQQREKRKYPACRPTPGDCNSKGRGSSWGKKSS